MIKEWKEIPKGSQTKERIEGSGSFRNSNGSKGPLGNKIELPFGMIKRITITFFALFINGFMGLVLTIIVYFSTSTLKSLLTSFIKMVANNPAAIALSLFPLLGLTVAYFAAAMWINKTIFKRTKKGIKITRGPLPWPNSNLLLRKSKTKQFYVQSYVRRTSRNTGRRIYEYRVMAIQEKNKQIMIVNGIHTYEDARILEQWLEDKLSIEDEIVEGEAVGAQ
jgi:hypothetical protein